ncbi:MAG: hypothetical protein GF317_03145 [Candidatus Lokiarchaeota archaeon]|nr:hypothetical protein [Candidatus Lokiarchaeota archaeon]MBD3198904.1 hypothetical protein [Candidatus Lokiarchaeota archaeon]
MKENTIESIPNLEVFETEIEIYNSKLRLLTWLYEELKLFSGDQKNKINKEGQALPINI